MKLKVTQETQRSSSKQAEVVLHHFSKYELLKVGGVSS